MRNPISFRAYVASADRVRQGRAQPMDVAICDAYDAHPQAPSGPAPRSVWDLPVARACLAGDTLDGTERL